MKSTIRVVDSKGRLSLPGFANATVVVETISDTECRVRKAKVIPEEELRFSEEEMPIVLSEGDARRFVAALENPPKPNAEARRAARRFKAKHG